MRPHCDHTLPHRRSGCGIDHLYLHSAHRRAALSAAQVQRNFRLVSDASFVPPFTVGTRASAHTFAAGVEHHLPAVTFGARRVRFAPCVVGGTSYHTIKFANNGDTPVRPRQPGF